MHEAFNQWQGCYCLSPYLALLLGKKKKAFLQKHVLSFPLLTYLSMP